MCPAPARTCGFSWVRGSDPNVTAATAAHWVNRSKTSPPVPPAGYTTDSRREFSATAASPMTTLPPAADRFRPPGVSTRAIQHAVALPTAQSLALFHDDGFAVAKRLPCTESPAMLAATRAAETLNLESSRPGEFHPRRRQAAIPDFLTSISKVCHDIAPAGCGSAPFPGSS